MILQYKYRSTKWNTKTIESQRPSLGPCWTFPVLAALQIEGSRHWPALRGFSSPPSTNTREPWPVPALALGGVGSLPRASQLQKEGPSSRL